MMKSGPLTRESGETRSSRSHKQRRYRRFALDARMVILRSGQNRPLYGRTLGVSQAGISGLLAADLELGESIHLEFALPGSSPSLAVRAVVRNRHGARYGFEFLSLSGGQREAIGGYCESQDE